MVRDVDMHITTNKYVVLDRDVAKARRMRYGKKFAAWSYNHAVTNRYVRAFDQVGMGTDL